jgi:hypothetical protein
LKVCFFFATHRPVTENETVLDGDGNLEIVAAAVAPMTPPFIAPTDRMPTPQK